MKNILITFTFVLLTIAAFSQNRDLDNAVFNIEEYRNGSIDSTVLVITAVDSTFNIEYRTYKGGNTTDPDIDRAIQLDTTTAQAILANPNTDRARQISRAFTNAAFYGFPTFERDIIAANQEFFQKTGKSLVAYYIDNYSSIYTGTWNITAITTGGTVTPTGTITQNGANSLNLAVGGNNFTVRPIADVIIRLENYPTPGSVFYLFRIEDSDPVEFRTLSIDDNFDTKITMIKQ